MEMAEVVLTIGEPAEDGNQQSRSDIKAGYGSRRLG